MKDITTGIGCVGSKDGRRSGLILNGEDVGAELGWGYMAGLDTDWLSCIDLRWLGLSWIRPG